MKKFCYDLLKETGIAPGTLDGVNTVLHSTFSTAVRDEIIKNNPTEGVMAEIKNCPEGMWRSGIRRSILAA